MRATYTPEDNKLRIYPDSTRVDSVLTEEEYADFKACGFKWAAKQECFVAPRWTPAAEDWALELCGEIEDEDYSPEERSADRAERFSGYRDKRHHEASGSADTFESGPSAFGHQNRGRAERQARRHDRHRLHALSQWGKAEYWQQRTSGVIAHALHRSSAAVRRGRLLRLEAEQRKHEANRDEYAKRYRSWEQVPTLEGPQMIVAKATGDYFGADMTRTSEAGRLAYALANASTCWGDYVHPRTGRKASLYSLLTDEADPITPAEASALWLAGKPHPNDEDSNAARWSRHYELRTGYEQAMLANEGGMAAEAEMEPGGWIGSHQIHKVNKSPVTGRVVSVTLKVPGDRWGNSSEGYHMRAFNIERMPEGAYRPPTDEEREAFKVSTKQRKAAEKAAKPAEPSLVNPTKADAERLQAILNARGQAKHEAKFAAKWEREHYPYKPTLVLEMTQAKYSELSKGTYSSFETRTLHNSGGIISRRSSNLWSSEGSAYDKALGTAVCKVRTRFASNSGSQWFNPPHIVVITDKPQKPLPLDWEAIAAGKEVAA